MVVTTRTLAGDTTRTTLRAAGKRAWSATRNPVAMKGATSPWRTNVGVTRYTRYGVQGGVALPQYPTQCPVS